MNLKGFTSKLKELLHEAGSMSVEPAGFFLMMSTLMTELVSQDLMIERICTVNLSFNATKCQEIVRANSTFENEEIEVQKIAAEIKTYISFFSYVIPSVLILIVGPWSDVYGRKLPMLCGIFGYIVEALVCLVFSFVASVDGWTVAIVSRVLKSLFGAELLFLLAANSYIADTTNESTRTIRIGLFTAGYTLGVPAGYSIGGIVTKANLGFPLSFTISSLICSVGFFIVLLRVNNQVFTAKTEDHSDDEEQLLLARKDTSRNTNGSCLSILNSTKTNMLQIFDILFKNKENGRHLKLWALLFAHACTAAPIFGESIMMYLFVRERLEWDAGDYGFFSTYNFLIGVVGNLVSLLVLTHLLKLSDPLVGLMSGISQIAGTLIYAFATNVFLMYLAPTIDMMNGTMSVIVRSMISKIVLPCEVGKMFTLIEIINSVLHLIVNPLYSTLYKFTIDKFSGYIFIMSAALSIPPLLTFAWFYWKSKTSHHLPTDIVEENKNYGSFE